MPLLADHDLASLAAEFTRLGLPSVHARKVLREFYASAGNPTSLNTATVGKGVVAWLAASPLVSSVVDRRSVSLDGTTKLLVRLADGAAVECVLMPTERPDRTMACVSSQVGCAMGCDFCASTKQGLERNLTAGEIAEQFIHLKLAAARTNRKITSLVFMGMGEPMHNLDAVIGGVRRIADPEMGSVGWRQVTVSTVGIVPGIDRLADADLNIHLALSLHAPDDATRGRLVPMNRKFAVADIVAAARRFYDRTGRIVTIEYCLLAGVNDSDGQAAMLADLLEGFRAHVNIIPYNPIGAGLTGIAYQRPTAERVLQFLTILREAGVVSHVRQTRGDDVAAACGQLREMATQSTVK
ncbi:23S rRNA (adenine(2503)-C(2))-methyltransferase RlmN [Humisphaera borealis]|uniref:Probable dual-specificity RNA methyltransferase RlmN n=1 Tax=Humisphaera borealis TaxID=2807512 RepID=A0A7M2WTI5_9BACT|nr:23S rRNA (adenine(2503)-C(2))-methyltransferase RlmN [Humisphaera borealis]QOV88828.1 23S rRNA (adenine(2503)-C(2))-methyltransferase RlmN [Humisphaera borealis]